MIALLGSYAELLSKLEKDEQVKYINKAMMRAKKECKTYEEKYTDTTMTLKKLCEIKSEILIIQPKNSYTTRILYN